MPYTSVPLPRFRYAKLAGSLFCGRFPACIIAAFFVATHNFAKTYACGLEKHIILVSDGLKYSKHIFRLLQLCLDLIQPPWYTILNKG